MTELRVFTIVIRSDKELNDAADLIADRVYRLFGVPQFIEVKEIYREEESNPE